MSSVLSSETLGRGDDLVLLHGWGMSGSFMKPFAERLSQRLRVTLVDLPGYGRSGLIDNLGLEGLARAVLDQVPRRAHWLGWSLGALVALHVAVGTPDAVRSLSMMAGTPRFLSAAGWPGVDPSLLSGFAAELERDYRRTIERFLALQLHGMDDERTLLKALRVWLAKQEPPRPEALTAGLAILENTDLRAVMNGLRCPLQMILGGRDRLIPAAVGEVVSRRRPDAEIRVIADAAHIPFWTHADGTAGYLMRFLERCDD